MDEITAMEGLYIFVDCLGIFASISSLFISITTHNLSKIFRPIFISYAAFNLCITILNLCDDVIPDFHNGYGGAGYLRLCVLGSSTLLTILHQLCFTYAESLLIRSTTGKKGLSHSTSLLMVVWALGLTAFGGFLAFAKVDLVFAITTVLFVTISFFILTFYYMNCIKKYRNNRLYLESIRQHDIKPVPGLKDLRWKDIYIPRLVFICYYTMAFPFTLYSTVQIFGGNFQAWCASRSIYLLIHDINYLLFSGLCFYLKLMDIFAKLPRLR
uniref:Uncharacterized protein n=1 Tax=Clytia hemisphaerica TaxID=252671 RepID=A0A7M5XDL8_9CNID|eukprot:TCONS_00058785-protein